MVCGSWQEVMDTRSAGSGNFDPRWLHLQKRCAIYCPILWVRFHSEIGIGMDGEGQHGFIDPFEFQRTELGDGVFF
jgi:hypothetical protein